jgi:RsmE family RNA methyltransferase
MNMVLLFPSDFTDDSNALIGDERRKKHLSTVLKIELGSIIKVGLVNGLTGVAEITAISQQTIAIKISLNTPPPAASNATLLFALPRPKTLKKVLQAATSLGIKEIVVFNSWKVEKSYWDSPVLNSKEVVEQLVLGLEQAGDTVMPNVNFYRYFKPFIEDKLDAITCSKSSFAAHPGAVNECPRGLNKPFVLCMGPEGGFTNYEISALEKHNFLPVNIGKRILRTEFALCTLIGMLS